MKQNQQIPVWINVEKKTPLLATIETRVKWHQWYVANAPVHKKLIINRL